MEKDLDMELYNEYLEGKKSAFELLYNKYKDKIKYFVYYIVKDYQKAEDITQEVFIYILQNKIKEGYTFKYYIYLIAKSRAYNYINMKKRRTEINEKYILNEVEQIQQDVADTVAKNEDRNELLNAINMLDDRYKNALYLVKIEEFSYQETAKILGESVQTIKNLIHRGKKELRKILVKKGFDEMNKVLKVIILVVCFSVLLSGIVYAAIVIYDNYIKNNTNHKIAINPTYQTTLDENTVNNLWVGTLDLAWKKLQSELGQKRINLVEGNLPIVEELNNSNFSEEKLDSKDYEIQLEKNFSGGYNIKATLNKNLNFLEVFDNFSNYNRNMTFGDGEKFIKYFGVNNATSEEVNKNVEILFFNNESKTSFFSNDFAIKLFTKEGDELILYRTDDNKSFDEYYEDIKNKSNAYTGRTEFSKSDELLIPYVRVNGMIAYHELYGKHIKETENDAMYFSDVVQNVNFILNEKGCNLGSSVDLVTVYMSTSEDAKFCYFKDQFVVFMKEKNCDEPYFALKVDNDDILEKIDEITEPKIVDYTQIDSEKYGLMGKEYKFFEDENYEYYFDIAKNLYIEVYLPDGTIDNIEWALKEGKIAIDLLDKYGIEYTKKEK